MERPVRNAVAAGALMGALLGGAVVAMTGGGPSAEQVAQARTQLEQSQQAFTDLTTTDPNSCEATTLRTMRQAKKLDGSSIPDTVTVMLDGICGTTEGSTFHVDLGKAAVQAISNVDKSQYDLNNLEDRQWSTTEAAVLIGFLTSSGALLGVAATAKLPGTDSEAAAPKPLEAI